MTERQARGHSHQPSPAGDGTPAGVGWQLGARTVAPLDSTGLTEELRRLGAAAREAAGMALHATGRAIRLEGLSPAWGEELRRQVRALGGEAAVGPSAYAGSAVERERDDGRPSAEPVAPDAVDVILLGSAAQLEALAERLAAGAADGRARSLGAAIGHALGSAEWRPGVLHLGRHRLDLARRVAVMGILNVTPDSFYDGGRHASQEAAIEHGLRLVEEGADLLDVGGDSAGGRAAPITAGEEIRRVEPVIRSLARQVPVPIAVDTHRAATAAAALDAGATMVNDITGLGDPAMAPTVARGDAGLAVMHIKGRPKHFPEDFDYRSLLGDVLRFLARRTDRALEAGVARERLMIDPGIEFGKLLYQDMELLRRLPELHVLGYPVLVAVSRKDFIGNVLGLPPEERLEGTAAAVSWAIARGAHLVRVHDVRAMVRVTRMTERLLGVGAGDDSQGKLRSDGTAV
jgi:dihydropteroate synthase